MNRQRIKQTNPINILTYLSVVLLAVGCATTSTVKQTSFASPDEAAQKLVDALRADDKDALLEIFGPDGKRVISSGDDAADRRQYEKFVQWYDQKHSFTPEKDGAVTLVIGDEDWPFPIPLVKEENAWWFDTASGEEEILRRRIGRNELATIQVCLAIVDAQREYAYDDPNNDGSHNYAARFLSNPGTKNGLYWETKEDEEPSPLGPLVSTASGEGYTKANKTSSCLPYHGYCFRMLKSQGPDALGGAYDYEVNGQMLGGFAVVAYPVQYGNSGIMTFIVNQDGFVYQKDLGPDTDKTARAMNAYDPGPGWEKAE